MSSFVFKFYLGHYSEERRDVVLLHCVYLRSCALGVGRVGSIEDYCILLLGNK